jgi:hypothetical protein
MRAASTNSARLAGVLAALDEAVGRPHGAQVAHQVEHRVVAHRDLVDIGDRQSKAGSLQQRAGFAHIGEGQHARARAAAQAGLGRKKALAQFRQRAGTRHAAEKQAVRAAAHA